VLQDKLLAQALVLSAKAVHLSGKRERGRIDRPDKRRAKSVTDSARAASSEIVRFENVGLRYGPSQETLSDISLSLVRGGFYFVAGPSGAGKTTLLKLLYLALRPSRGVMTLFGEDMVTLPRDRLPGFRRRIGVVFQDFRLVPHLTAFDNVALPLRIAGLTESDLRGPVQEMLDWVDLSDRADALPQHLSGGEQQRVAIARAVIGRPELLVADEPTGNVDPDMAVRLLQLFEGLNRIGTTVVVATHDVHLMNRVPGAHLMRVAKGRLADPTGALRFPPGSRPVRHA
jgi:cell division transport system ATP-binding protein